MKFEFEGRIYHLHYSFRIGLIYEEIQKKSIDFSNLSQLDLITLFYAAFIATLQYNKVNNTIKFEDFMNWIDDNGGEKLIIDFTHWYIDVMKQQAALISQPTEDEEVKGERDPNG